MVNERRNWGQALLDDLTEGTSKVRVSSNERKAVTGIYMGLFRKRDTLGGIQWFLRVKEGQRLVLLHTKQLRQVTIIHS